METGFKFFTVRKKFRGCEQSYEGWRFRLNGKAIARSGQVFEWRDYVLRSISLTVRRAIQAELFKEDYLRRVPFFVIFQGKNNRWYWDLKGANRHVICSCFESFASKADALGGAVLFKKEMKKLYRGKKCK